MGAANRAQSSREGIYILQPDDVNGKEHWLQQDSLDGRLNAIWFDKEFPGWNIGLIKNLGSSNSALYSDNSTGPLEATTWKYLSGPTWVEATDLIIVSAGI